MNRWKSIFSLAVLALVCLLLSSCGRSARVEGSLDIVTPVDESTIKSYVLDYPGYAVLLFYNDAYWQSRDMAERVAFLAERYERKVRFCKYQWNVKESGKKYGLEMLPTVILYQHGKEIDRIKGVPERPQDRLEWNNDLNLWLQKNALGAEGDQYTGSYRYLFKNSAELNISNY